MPLHLRRATQTPSSDLNQSKSRTRTAVSCAMACAAASSFIIAAPERAHAASLTLECARADVFNPSWDAPITFVFEGDERGTLKVAGALGEFEIPASRQPLQIEPGQIGEAIDGNAKAHVKLPALSDLDACIDKGSGGSTDATSDAFLNARDQCMRTLPPASSGTDAVAQIRLGFTGDSSGGEDAFVVFKLIYDAVSRAPGGKMIAEAFPAQCKLKK